MGSSSSSSCRTAAQASSGDCEVDRTTSAPPGRARFDAAFWVGRFAVPEPSPLEPTTGLPDSSAVMITSTVTSTWLPRCERVVFTCIPSDLPKAYGAIATGVPPTKMPSERKLGVSDSAFSPARSTGATPCT